MLSLIYAKSAKRGNLIKSVSEAASHERNRDKYYNKPQSHNQIIIVPTIVGKFFMPNLLRFLGYPNHNNLWLKLPTTEFGTVTPNIKCLFTLFTLLR